MTNLTDSLRSIEIEDAHAEADALHAKAEEAASRARFATTETGRRNLMRRARRFIYQASTARRRAEELEAAR